MGFKSFFSSKKTSIVLLSIYTILLILGTLVNHYVSLDMAKIAIYYSPLTTFILILLVINFFFLLKNTSYLKQKKIAFLCIHFALVIILIGASITHLFSVEGSIHIRESKNTDQFLIRTNKAEYYKELPFTLHLEKFVLTNYPGSNTPSSYQSYLIIEDKHSQKKQQELLEMNKIIDYQGYRLFQSSYDDDEKGTIISVSKDTLGRKVTYTGYSILLIGFLLFFFHKHSKFRSLIRLLKHKTKHITPLLLFVFCVNLTTQSTYGNTQTTIEIQKSATLKEHLDYFSALPMLSNDGRMMPIQTFASEVTRKLFKSTSVEGVSPVQFLLEVTLFPDLWMHKKLFTIESKALAQEFDLQKKAAYIDFFTTKGEYRLTMHLERIQRKSTNEYSAFDKEFLKLNEQIYIFNQLITQERLTIFPNRKDDNKSWHAPSEILPHDSKKIEEEIHTLFNNYKQALDIAYKENNWYQANTTLEAIAQYQKENSLFTIDFNKIKAELLYNKLDPFNVCKLAYLILASFVLLYSFIALFTQKRIQNKFIFNSFVAITCLFFILHTFGLILRGYIAGYSPWSNSYETMIYIAWITIGSGLLLRKFSDITYGLTLLFGGITLLVASFNWLNPAIGTLIPVLKSHWLSIHVAIIVSAYGFLGISCFLGLTNTILYFINTRSIHKSSFLLQRIEILSIINELSVYIGLALLTLGTFAGAVWANESWGRYWGWDPKETWALITILVYTLVTHTQLFKMNKKEWAFNLLTVIAFLAVLMTYFGVNYWMSGLHSYA